MMTSTKSSNFWFARMKIHSSIIKCPFQVFFLSSFPFNLELLFSIQWNFVYGVWHIVKWYLISMQNTKYKWFFVIKFFCFHFSLNLSLTHFLFIFVFIHFRWCGKFVMELFGRFKENSPQPNGLNTRPPLSMLSIEWHILCMCMWCAFGGIDPLNGFTTEHWTYSGNSFGRWLLLCEHI